MLSCFQLNFHGSSLESLHKHFSVDILPEEVGGTMPSGEKLALVSICCMICGAALKVHGWAPLYCITRAFGFFFYNTL